MKPPRPKPARAQHSRSKLPRALELELKRAARGPSADEAIRWMEQLLRARDKGDLAGTRRAAIRAKQAAPRSVSVREALGLVSHELGEWHEAAQELLAFRRLTGERGHDPLIADCYRKQERPERALELLADIRPGTAGEEVWARAQVIRAGAAADTDRLDIARGFLDAALRDARGARALAILTAAKRHLSA